MEKVELYNFNIFSLQKHTQGNELESTVSYIFAKEGIFEEVPLMKLKFFNFMNKIKSLYKDITYHNKTHAADLVQTFYHATTIGEMALKCQMNKFEIMAYLLAGACHDVEHPGYNNLFLVETRDSIANTYND